MSRSFRSHHGSTRNRRWWVAPVRAETRRSLREELRAVDDQLLQVLADFHEEHGRMWLADRLRRGHEPLFPQHALRP